MCGRLEQLRTEFVVRRPSELAGPHTRPKQTLEVMNGPAAAEQPQPAARAPTEAVTGESQAPPPKPDAPPDGPTAMLLPSRERARKWSTAATESSATGEDKTPRKAPGAGRISRGRTVLQRAASAARWTVSQTAIWVVIMSVLIGALVPLLITR
jgi:hypothetical protein